jgi:hypothetical protein
LRYPDFLCIGAQKAGTTWLHKKLGQHPDIWLPPLKEIHYFDALHLGAAKFPGTKRADAAFRAIERVLDDDLASAEKLETVRTLCHIGLRDLTDTWYGSIFAHAGAQPVCGEITPAYALLPETGIEHIVRLQPATRIIYVLRDPIDRAWSELRMAERKSGKGDFQRRIAADLFVGHCDYVGVLERFRRHVAESSLLVLYFDDIAERPQQVISELCRFLGVDSARGRFRGLETAVHRGSLETMDPVVHGMLRERLEPVYAALLNHKYPYAEQWYRRHYGQTAAEQCAS